MKNASSLLSERERITISPEILNTLQSTTAIDVATTFSTLCVEPGQVAATYCAGTSTQMPQQACTTSIEKTRPFTQWSLRSQEKPQHRATAPAASARARQIAA